MIPILYDSNEVAFASNGLGRLPDCLSCKVTEERNGIYEVDFEYPVDGLHYDLLQAGRIIGVTHDDNGDIQPFDIVGHTRPINGVVTFHGVHVSYRLNQCVVSGKNINSLSDALTLLGTAKPANGFTYYTDKSSTAYLAAADGEPRTVRQMLGGVEGSILDTYGGEFEFNRFTVRLLRSRGIDRDFIIRYGVNLSEYNEETDYSETYTAAVPFWRGDNGKGSEVIVKGDLTTSGAQSYSGRTLAIPMDLSDKFETKPTKAQLETLAASIMQSGQTFLPQQSITVNFVDIYNTGEYEALAPLTTCNLCDTVGVVFPKYNMSGRFKIVKTVFDVLRGTYSEMELGTLSTSLAEALGVDGGGLSSSYSLDVQELSPTYTRTSGTPATGVEVTGWRWGQTVQLNFKFSRYATSAYGDMAVGTLSNVPTPLGDVVRGVAYAGSSSTPAVCVLNINTSDMTVRVRTNAALTTSSTTYVYFQVTYITND